MSPLWSFGFKTDALHVVKGGVNRARFADVRNLRLVEHDDLSSMPHTLETICLYQALFKHQDNSFRLTPSSLRILAAESPG